MQPRFPWGPGLRSRDGSFETSTVQKFQKLYGGRGQTAEARRTTILQPVEQKPHSQKDRQDEKAEGYVPDEETR